MNSEKYIYQISVDNGALMAQDVDGRWKDEKLHKYSEAIIGSVVNGIGVVGFLNDGEGNIDKIIIDTKLGDLTKFDKNPVISLKRYVGTYSAYKIMSLLIEATKVAADYGNTDTVALINDTISDFKITKVKD